MTCMTENLHRPKDGSLTRENPKQHETTPASAVLYHLEEEHQTTVGLEQLQFTNCVT